MNRQSIISDKSVPSIFVSFLAIFGGGAGLSYGLQQGNPVISVISIIFGLTFVVIEELLLRHRREP